MNIYFCHEKTDSGGRFVSAPSRARARAAFSSYMGCLYADVRIRSVATGAAVEGKVFKLNDPDLARLGLGYKENVKHTYNKTHQR